MTVAPSERGISHSPEAVPILNINLNDFARRTGGEATGGNFSRYGKFFIEYPGATMKFVIEGYWDEGSIPALYVGDNTVVLAGARVLQQKHRGVIVRTVDSGTDDSGTDDSLYLNTVIIEKGRIIHTMLPTTIEDIKAGDDKAFAKAALLSLIDTRRYNEQVAGEGLNSYVESGILDERRDRAEQEKKAATARRIKAEEIFAQWKSQVLQ